MKYKRNVRADREINSGVTTQNSGGTNIVVRRYAMPMRPKTLYCDRRRRRRGAVA